MNAQSKVLTRKAKFLIMGAALVYAFSVLAIMLLLLGNLPKAAKSTTTPVLSGAIHLDLLGFLAFLVIVRWMPPLIGNRFSNLNSIILRILVGGFMVGLGFWALLINLSTYPEILNHQWDNASFASVLMWNAVIWTGLYIAYPNPHDYHVTGYLMMMMFVCMYEASLAAKAPISFILGIALGQGFALVFFAVIAELVHQTFRDVARSAVKIATITRDIAKWAIRKSQDGKNKVQPAESQTDHNEREMWYDY